jgi:hypothetical protein
MVIHLHLKNLRKFLFIILAVFCAGAQAQVVQLPAVRQFSYSGGALVPDSGTAYLGGNSYNSTGSVSRGGIPNNRTFGGIGGGSHVSASVQIIDLDALDQAILNSNVPPADIHKSNRKLAVSDEAAADQARKFLSTYNPTAKTARNGDPSYRDVKQALGNSTKAEPIDASLAEANVRYYLKKGQEAETANRIQSARVYYKMAIDAMTPEIINRYNKVLSDREEAEKAKKDNAKKNVKKF